MGTRLDLFTINFSVVDCLLVSFTHHGILDHTERKHSLSNWCLKLRSKGDNHARLAISLPVITFDVKEVTLRKRKHFTFGFTTHFVHQLVFKSQNNILDYRGVLNFNVANCSRFN